ncbi:hypothetical protein D5086_003081 [Populus alba]|uniref:Uncharacterized protein n=1 Tax=Populus alba TaxID=43335 RepID=A0ACC4D3B4_POPAL
MMRISFCWCSVARFCLLLRSWWWLVVVFSLLDWLKAIIVAGGQVLLAVDGCVGTSPTCCWLVVLVHCHLLFSLVVSVPAPGFSVGCCLMVNYLLVSSVVAFG